MAKTYTSCNWVQSRVTEEELNNFVATSALAKKDDIHWRAPDEEIPPKPKDGEVIVFADHLSRGFSPPGSKFFRDVLHFFQLHPQDIGPNSVSNICNFQVFCEAYLREEPTVDLFREFYYLNHQTKFTDRPSQDLGGVSIQKGKRSAFPMLSRIATPKTGTKLGSIVKIHLQPVRILCRVTVTTGLVAHIHSPHGSLRRNGPNMHQHFQSSEPLWPMA